VNTNQEIILAIYPFENLTEGEGLDIFCRSFYIDLVTELSRFRQFRIISLDSIVARNSPIPEADYLISGSFRYLNGQLRINAQLVNGHTKHIPWADHFEGDKESIFAIQNQLLNEIVSSLQVQLNYDLLTQIRTKSPVSLTAYESWLYGMEELRQGTQQSDERARSFFERAIEISPSYSLAYSGMSLTYFNEWSCQLWERWELNQKGAFEWAQKAIALDEQNYVAAAVIGRVYLYEGEYEKAEHYIRLCLRLNSNDIDNLVNVASSLTFLGYATEAEALYEKVLLLNPLNINQYNQIGAFIAFELGNFEKCVALAANTEYSWVDFPAYVAAAYFNLNDVPNMRRHWENFLEGFRTKIAKTTTADPQEALEWMIKVNPCRNEMRIASFWQFMRDNANQSYTPSVVNQYLPRENAMILRGDLWEIHFDGKISRVPDMKGLRDLIRLLQNPEQEFHCTDLLGAPVLVGETEFVFDEKAKRSYQQRLLELQEEISVAEQSNDLKRGSGLRQEYDELISHLSTSLGLRGRTRKTNDHVDKARSAVTWRIRKAIEKIQKVDASLAKHLTLAVKTGIFCRYVPERSSNWSVEV
jgi:TolB-like protein